MSPVPLSSLPVSKLLSSRVVSRAQWLSVQRWRALVLNQQRLRWAECGMRIGARMDAAGYCEHGDFSQGLIAVRR
ncbi:MAG: hypothetical protein ACRBBW_05625 [Cellvibrionaceae bacterium]